MPNSYQWAVNSLSSYPQYQGKENVVFQIAWVCSATDGTYNSATYGVVDVQYEPSDPFTPYQDLTLEKVLDWVHEQLGPEGIAKAQADCDVKINEQKNVTTETLPLPWNVPSETVSTSPIEPSE